MDGRGSTNKMGWRRIVDTWAVEPGMANELVSFSPKIIIILNIVSK